MATLATVTFWTDSGLVEDQCVNTFAIGSDITGIVDAGGGAQPNVAAMTDLAVALARFYNADDPVTLESPSSFMSPVLDIGAQRSTVRFYDISANMNALTQAQGGVPSGSPIGTRTFTLAAPGNPNGLPSECAVVVTLEGVGRADAPVEAPDGSDLNALLDRPKQRRTGRLYIGPLNELSTIDAVGSVRPMAALTDTLRANAVRLDLEIRAVLGDFFLGVWSRSDGIIRRLEAVSTDNAFDTQRRRGEAGTARVRTAVP